MLSLLFETAGRPDVSAIRDLSQMDGGFSISHDPGFAGGGDDTGEEGRWLELLMNGLTFDLMGVGPGSAQTLTPYSRTYDIPTALVPETLEAVALVSGPHLVGGETMLPVVRSHVGLGAKLCSLPGLRAVGWQSARCLCSPAFFAENISRWLEGGLFPALGLTSLASAPDGGMQSEGLAFFINQELRIEPELMTDQTDAVRLAVKLIHQLIEQGGIDHEERAIGLDGEKLQLKLSENRRFVRVSSAGL